VTNIYTRSLRNFLRSQIFIIVELKTLRPPPMDKTP